MKPIEIIFFIFYTFLLLILFIYAFHAYLMLFLYRRNKKKFKNECQSLSTFPKVTVQLPVYNEEYVVERLIRSVCAMEYPKDKLEVQVLDDSTDETRAIAQSLVQAYERDGYNIRYCHREKREGYKAGALREGLKFAEGEFIAIFDADFVPPKDFLLRAIPYFNNPQIGVVQSRWGHLNDDYSLLTWGQALGLDGHFVIEQVVRNVVGVFINFNGTAGIWRKECILDAGNWQDDTLTEDMDLSYRAQLKGWKFIYLQDLVCPAEIPAEINGFKNQQYRWAKGTSQTAKKILPLIWKRKDLSLPIKFEATIHLTGNLVFPVMLLIALFTFPILVLKVTCQPARGYFLALSIFSLGALSYPLYYLYGQKEVYPDWKKRALYLPILMGGGFGSSIINTRAVLEALLNLKSDWLRTPKYNLTKKENNWRGKKYQVNLSLLTLAEILVGVYSFWTLFYAFKENQLAIVPFVFLYCFGFTFVGILSLAHAFKK
ncbi:MAG: glycosyltransferase [Candidatus Edwardsbacteria bacterium]